MPLRRPPDAAAVRPGGCQKCPHRRIVFQQDNQTMKRIFNHTLLSVVSLATLFAVNGSAQDRTRPARRTPPAHAKPTPSPTPTPSSVTTIAETPLPPGQRA